VAGLYAAKNICPEGLFLVTKVFNWAFDGANMKVTSNGRVKRSTFKASIDAITDFVGDAGAFTEGVQGITYVDKSGNIFCFLPVMGVEHTWRPAHIRARDGKKFSEESTCRLTFSRSFVSSVTGDVNIPVDFGENKMVVQHFQPTPLKMALLKLHVFLQVANRTTAVGSAPLFSAELKTTKIAFYLAAVGSLLPPQHYHETVYYEEVLDELPIGTIQPAYQAPYLEMGTFALLQEVDCVVVVQLIEVRPPSMIIGPSEDGDPWPVEQETVKVHEWRAPKLSGEWVPIWDLDKEKGRNGLNKIRYSKRKPGLNAIVPERWIFPESLAMVDVTLTAGGRLPVVVVREFAAHCPDLPIW
jgi:hypothetical protein